MVEWREAEPSIAEQVREDVRPTSTYRSASAPVVSVFEGVIERSSKRAASRKQI
jgi:hypothetical protein